MAKDQTFTKFYEFKALVEKESGKKVKDLQSDNNGEFISNEFKKFYVVGVIKRELKTPHNPQQNGYQEEEQENSKGNNDNVT